MIRLSVITQRKIRSDSRCSLNSLLLRHISQLIYFFNIETETLSNTTTVFFIRFIEYRRLAELNPLLSIAEMSRYITNQMIPVFIRHDSPVQLSCLEEVIIRMNVRLTGRLS